MSGQTPRHPRRHWLSLPYNDFDLRVLIILLAALVACAIVIVLNPPLAERWGLTEQEPRNLLHQGEVIAAVILLVAGFAAWIVRTAQDRSSHLQMFQSEITALLYGLEEVHMLEFWTALYQKPDSWPMAWADVPRGEDYFSLYHASITALGTLRPSFVESAVRHYTYLKMSRDAARGLDAFKRLKPDLETPEECRATPDDTPANRKRQPPDDITRLKQLQTHDIIKLLSLSLLWGFICLYRSGRRANQTEERLLVAAFLAYNETRETITGTPIHAVVESLPLAATKDLGRFFYALLDGNSLAAFNPKSCPASRPQVQVFERILGDLNALKVSASPDPPASSWSLGLHLRASSDDTKAVHPFS
jgi:hypothetical protein